MLANECSSLVPRITYLFQMLPSRNVPLTKLLWGKSPLIQKVRLPRVVLKIVIRELKSKGNFATMSFSQDEDEHSLEMHLPYIYAIFANYTPSNSTSDQGKYASIPPLVPIMVGATIASKEKEYGRLLAPYVANPENLFIISSDFCHWYLPHLTV